MVDSLDDAGRERQAPAGAPSRLAAATLSPSPIAQVLADMATGYIINARTLSETERVAGQLQHALDSRIVIEQAEGILAERHGTDPATAFDRLRAKARSNNRKVHDVARAVVDGSLTL